MNDRRRENEFVVDGRSEIDFDPLWPTESRGSGLPVKNNLRTGSAQGKGSHILKAHCLQCGFPNDTNAVDHSGGSLDGNGAQYVVSTGTATFTLPNGTTHTEQYGVPGIRDGAGCAHCGSKHNTTKAEVEQPKDIHNQPPVGF